MAKRGHTKLPGVNILKGLLFDRAGMPYSPLHAKKGNGRSYRYYVSQNRIQQRDRPKRVMARLPAHEIELAVLNAINKHLCTPALLHLDPIEDHAVFTAHCQ